MYNLNDDTQNFLFFRLKLVGKTYEHKTYSINQSEFPKVPKVVKPTNKKTLLLDFGDLCNKHPTVPSLSGLKGR